MSRESRGSFLGLLSGLLALVFLLAICVSVAAYSMGWMTVENTPDRTTIEVDTAEMREAAGEVSKQGEQTLEKTGEALHDAGEQIKDAVDDDGTRDETTDEPIETKPDPEA